jgi:hypothetical protein
MVVVRCRAEWVCGFAAQYAEAGMEASFFFLGAGGRYFPGPARRELARGIKKPGL